MPKSEGQQCSHCGYNHATAKPYSGALPLFSVLNGHYLLGRVLGRGGFGITYVAKDITTNRVCAIKEYMPSEWATRNGSTQSIIPHEGTKAQYVFQHGKEKFLEEARTLAKLRDNPIVVDIWDYFQQNNTAYLVMEYLDGSDLRKKAKTNGGTLDTDYMKNIFVTIASSLMTVHNLNILHRDLSPENIIVTSDDRIKLIDFGAARNFVSTQNVGMSILLKPGFAPPEQYDKKGAQGPWSDVYALCATFYTLVSGKPLVDAMFRYRGQEQPSLASLGCKVTQRTSDVIQRGMELDYRKRYRDFKALLDEIDITISTVRPKEERVKEVPPKQDPQGGVKSKQIIGNPGQLQRMQLYVAAVMRNGLYNKMQVRQNDILKIGRSQQSCQYTIAGDTNISRIHCYVRYDGQNIYLADNSSNGTFFEDGRRLNMGTEYKIKPGTKFYLSTPNHMLIVNV